jgi:hypothetical protein
MRVSLGFLVAVVSAVLAVSILGAILISRTKTPTTPETMKTAADLMDGPFFDGTFQSRRQWFLQTQDPQSRAVRSDLRVWRFSSEGLTCLVFVQTLDNSAKVPSSSCWPSWLIW